MQKIQYFQRIHENKVSLKIFYYDVWFSNSFNTVNSSCVEEVTCVCWSRVLTVLRVVHEGVAPGLLIAEACLEAKLRVGCVHGGCCWGWCTRGHSNGGAVAIATWQQRVSTLLYLLIWGWDNSEYLSLNMFHQIWLTEYDTDLL